jgi:nicotinamide-nucleotide amidase
MMDDELHAAARRTIDACAARQLTIATAESCTGGLVVGALTEIPGSSAVVLCGFITYSNAAKESMLGVPSQILQQHGAVSQATAQAMSDGALARSPADLTVAITGVAGPGGGSPDKPVGLVHFAAAARSGARTTRAERFGEIGRAEVRRQSVLVALTMLEQLASGYAAP